MNYQTNHLVDELSIPIDGSMVNTDEDFMSKLLRSSKTIRTALIVSRDMVFKSSGMTYVPSGTISIIDVVRVVGASIPILNNDCVCLPASTKTNYFIDDTLHKEFMPIRLCGRKLEAQVELVHVNNELLSHFKCSFPRSRQKHSWMAC